MSKILKLVHHDTQNFIYHDMKLNLLSQYTIYYHLLHITSARCTLIRLQKWLMSEGRVDVARASPLFLVHLIMQKLIIYSNNNIQAVSINMLHTDDKLRLRISGFCIHRRNTTAR